MLDNDASLRNNQKVQQLIAEMVIADTIRVKADPGVTLEFSEFFANGEIDGEGYKILWERTQDECEAITAAGVNEQLEMKPGPRFLFLPLASQMELVVAELLVMRLKFMDRLSQPIFEI